MPVRTLQVFHGRNLPPNAFTVAYTVPAGHTLIVKDWRIANQTPGSVEINLAVRRAGVVTPVDRRQGVAPATVVAGSGLVVLEPADELVVRAEVPAGASADVTWLVSGALLEGVSSG